MVFNNKATYDLTKKKQYDLFNNLQTTNVKRLFHFLNNSQDRGVNFCLFKGPLFVQSELSRDKTLMVSDFWLKTVDSLGPKESESGRLRHSRFLNRDIMSL